MLGHNIVLEIKAPSFIQLPFYYYKLSTLFATIFLLFGETLPIYERGYYAIIVVKDQQYSLFLQPKLDMLSK